MKRLKYIRGSKPSYSQGSYQRPTDDGEDIYQPAIQNKGNVKNWEEFGRWITNWKRLQIRYLDTRWMCM